LESAKNGNLATDKNTLALVSYYQYLERATLGNVQEERQRSQEAVMVDSEIERFFKQRSTDSVQLMNHFVNKMLIFSCIDPDYREMYIQCFKLMKENGERWQQADLDRTLVQEFQDAEISNQPLPNFQS